MTSPSTTGRVSSRHLRSGAALAIACMVAAALAAHQYFETDFAQPLVAVMIFAAMLAVAMRSRARHHPFPRLGAANRVTLLRAALVAGAASLLVEPVTASHAWALVGMAIVVVALDGLDGWLARRSGMSSTFGARFDMETDAFFMLVLAALVWRYGKAGGWVLAIGLLRYAFVAAARFLPWLAQPLRSTLRGKTMAVVGLVTLGASLAPVLPTRLTAPACACALAGLTYSFAVDVLHLYRIRES